MRHFLPKASIPLMAAAIVLTATATSQAQWFGLYWDSYWPSYSYSSYPSYYSSYYSPSYYTSSYIPTYTTSYVPSVSYYGGSSCCSPCSSCVSCGPSCSSCSPCGSSCSSCNTCCSPCNICGSTDCNGDCALGSSNSQNNTPTPASRPNANTPAGNRTFIEENDRGTGQGYERPSTGTGDGFAPRNSNENTGTNPMDGNFEATAGGRDQLRFKVPSSNFNREESTPSYELEFKSPTRRVKTESSDRPTFPLLNLDEKITSRPMPQRTRLLERRSWEQPAIARSDADRETSDINLGWVPMPAPARLVQR